MNKFKENLSLYRKQIGITQGKLASQLGVTEGSVRHWEKGRTEPDIDTLLKLCKILKVSIEELLL